MKVNLRIWNITGLNSFGNRYLIKTSLQKWKDVHCFQETKLNKDVEVLAKLLWPSRWKNCGYLEVGSSGGIVIMWHSKVWMGCE